MTAGYAAWLAVGLGVAAAETLLYAQVTGLQLLRATLVALAANSVTAAVSFRC